MKLDKLEFVEQDALITRAASGNAQARQELTRQLWPFWVGLIRTSRSMGPLSRSDDHVYEVASRVLAKFSGGEHVQQYLTWRAREPTKSFEDWTRIVVTNQIRDYAREVLGARSASNAEPSVKRLLNEFGMLGLESEPSTRPPFTETETARELIEFARSRLPDAQLTALEGWLEGASYDEIEQRLGVPSGDGKRLVRAAVAVLRRQFSGNLTESDRIA